MILNIKKGSFSPFRLNVLIGLLGFCFFATPAVAQVDPTDSAEDYTVSKGRAYGVLTFSLDQRDAENENQLLRQVIDQNKLDYRVIASGAMRSMIILPWAGLQLWTPAARYHLPQ
jgi:hypothetical protein